MRKTGLLLYFLPLLFFFSCTNNHPPAKQPPAATKELKNINFFLETSASMEGYLRGGSAFSKMIPNLLVEIENRINAKSKTININYIADSITRYPKTTRDFIHDISTTPVASAKSSEMHRIFEMVTDKTGPNDISIFVSDCILSYSDAEIKKNREINRTNAEGELKAFIEDAFLKIKKRNICASLYGFNSKFYATYYNYQNGHMPMHGEINRPFYIWIIGDKELLQDFNKQLAEKVNFKPELSIDFGIFQKPVDTFNILFKTARSGDWAARGNEISGIDISKSKPARFTIAVDLTTLPSYARDINYLKRMLKADVTDGAGNITDVKKATDIDMDKAAPHEKLFLQQASHVITVEITDMYKSSGTVTIRLPLQYDTAYTGWSVMDDRNMADIDGKTFAFKHLVDGVREAYQNNNENFINISIRLKK